MTSKMTNARAISLLCCVAASVLLARPLIAAEAVPPIENWFQVEMTIFTHENSNLELEIWSPAKLSLDFPERLRKLTKLSDFLQLNDWSVLSGVVDPVSVAVATEPLQGAPVQPLPTPLIGPLPYAPGESFRLPDFERAPYLALLEADHDFVGTNRALTQSAGHRILFHSAWRLPMTRRNSATAIAVTGGRIFSGRSELEGSVSFYYNNAGDRIVFDSNLWFSSFSTVPDTEQQWTLPVLPAVMAMADAATGTEPVAYYVNRIMQLRQTRDMRSDEFHYVDHPAVGILVQLTPYTVPPMPEPEPELEPELDPADVGGALLPQ